MLDRRCGFVTCRNERTHQRGHQPKVFKIIQEKNSLKMALNHWAGMDCNRRRTTLTRSIPDGSSFFQGSHFGVNRMLKTKDLFLSVGQACPERSSKQKTPCNSIVKHRVSHTSMVASGSLEVNRWLTDCTVEISGDLPGLRISQLSSRIMVNSVQMTSRVV